MIKVIGTKLIAILLVFIVLNATLVGSWFFITTPMKEQAQLELNAINNEITKLRASITNIKDELKYYDENKVAFDALSETGYMEEQNRLSIAKFLEAARKASRIQKLSFDISDTKGIENKIATRAKHQLITRRITLKSINAFFDTDIYNFIYTLNEKFPGHTRVISVDITRTPLEDFDTAIDSIAAGNQENFITSNVKIDWYALIKLPEDNPLPTRPR